jgi:O-6-methylguanine DNA methyltransferase
MKQAYYEFEFGTLRITTDGDFVTRLDCVGGPRAPGERTAASDAAFCELQQYLAGTRRQFTFAHRAQGTEFQKKVWQALTEIPYGQTRTYGQIAAAIGNPKASRAVGMANNKNPLMIVVPCHRVIGAGGSLVGYAGGLDMKRRLLQIERCEVNG